MDLKDGEVICEKCDGKGYYIEYGEWNILISPLSKPHGFPKKMYICNKCKGKGKLDWIENIIGCRNGIQYPVNHCLEVDI